MNQFQKGRYQSNVFVLPFTDFLRNVLFFKKLFDVQFFAAHIVGIQMQNVKVFDFVSGLLIDIALKGQVVDVVILDFGRRFDFNHIPSATILFQNVYPAVTPVFRQRCRFKQDIVFLRGFGGLFGVVRNVPQFAFQIDTVAEKTMR